MAARFDLYYGEPGTAKSRSVIELIKRFCEKNPEKIARVYIGDGSRGMYEESGLVDKGKIKIFEFALRDEPFSTCQQMCEGFWPSDENNPWSKLRKLTPAEVAETGLWVFEGASVMGQYMMGDKPGGLAYRSGQGNETIGQDTPIRFVDKESGMIFGGNPGAHYNVAQRHLHSDILRTKAFPGWVIWTAHERMDDGERGGSFSKSGGNEKTKLGEKLIGPELVGKALTSNISRDFGNTLHFTIAGKKKQDGIDPITGKTNYIETQEYRVYTRDHYDPDGIVGLKYRAINRSMNPDMIKDYYVGEKPGEALLQFYSDLEKSKLKG